MADTASFTGHPQVRAAVQKVRDECAGREYSDIVDAEGRQYVDLVMEGGGVLGIALTGYTYLLEQAGIRFLGIGGTSAGAINALMIAALGPPDSAKSEALVRLLADIPLHSFIDGDDDARDFCAALLRKASLITLVWKGAQVVDSLNDHLGLNPGEKFLDWLSSALEHAGVRTNADLAARLGGAATRLRARRGRTLKPGDTLGRLAMVAADITTETKVEFPRMARLYWARPETVNPAYFARASMSIPFFFRPFEVDDIPQDRAAAWAELAGYHGELPSRVKFMDGGIVSNFPINLFHEPHCVPIAPTFGAKIGIDRSAPRAIGKPLQLLGAIFDSARHTLDYDFIVQNPDYRHLVTMIDTKDHNWLDFSVSDEAKVDLFACGAGAAADFLCAFDWKKYKEIRKGTAEAFVAAYGEPR